MGTMFENIILEESQKENRTRLNTRSVSASLLQPSERPTAQVTFVAKQHAKFELCLCSSHVLFILYVSQVKFFGHFLQSVPQMSFRHHESPRAITCFRAERLGERSIAYPTNCTLSAVLTDPGAPYPPTRWVPCSLFQLLNRKLNSVHIVDGFALCVAIAEW